MLIANNIDHEKLQVSIINTETGVETLHNWVDLVPRLNRGEIQIDGICASATRGKNCDDFYYKTRIKKCNNILYWKNNDGTPREVLVYLDDYTGKLNINISSSVYSDVSINTVNFLCDNGFIFRYISRQKKKLLEEFRVNNSIQIQIKSALAKLKILSNNLSEALSGVEFFSTSGFYHDDYDARKVVDICKVLFNKDKYTVLDLSSIMKTELVKLFKSEFDLDVKVYTSGEFRVRCNILSDSLNFLDENILLDVSEYTYYPYCD